MSETNSANLIDDFQQTLVDCRQLYLTAGRECCQAIAPLSGRSPREFMQMMDELHRGLLIKIYLEVALADQRWQPMEQQLAQHLLRHLWNRRLEGTALREAIRGLHARAQRLSFRSVLQPFLEIDPLKEQICQVETIVMRLANLVAKADGDFSAAESARLRGLQQTFERIYAQMGASVRETPSNPTIRPGPESSLGADEAALATAPGSPPPLPASPVPITLTPEENLRLALERLDQMIGLPEVKREVQMLANFLKVQQGRQQAGLPETPLSLHLVFVGNPGTGKTTVARIVGQIYGAMGVLERGHVVETDRSGLVAEYAGQTATKTNQRVDEALDGVLFIDEAYSLVAESGDDAFGREALQALLKRMEDDRHRLAVILAGYPAPMDSLLKSNPGLSSRFGRKLSFEDYTCMQLAEIFAQLCEQNHYELSTEVRCRLLLAFKWLHDHRDPHFGNARLVRNRFEDAIRRLANRIADVTPLTHELLTEFHPRDLQFPDVPSEWWQCWPLDSAPFRAHCPGCQRQHQVSGSLLGRRVRCSACQQVFNVDWAEPLAASD